MAAEPGRYGGSDRIEGRTKLLYKIRLSMKKNSRQYRIKNKKTLRHEYILKNNINQEVNSIKIIDLTMSHIVSLNPICGECEEVKRKYFDKLVQYLKIGGGSRRKYEKSEIDAYRNIIFASNEIKEKHSFDYYSYYIMLDFLHIIGYETSKISSEKWNEIKKQYLDDFDNVTVGDFKKIINFVNVADNRNLKFIKNETEYIKAIRKNLLFRKKSLTNLMVTATMSAGKSTFINALVGKYICLSQNMSCTSKIHSIINKSFEDGYTTEYDHDLIMTAGKEELLNDNEENLSDIIYVATAFSGILKNSRIIVNDSPGVNFSGNNEHKQITDKLIKRRNYELLIYLMNSTQLGTSDEDEHLEFVKHSVGRIPVIFVMNKVDLLNPDEEDILKIIDRQKAYLKKKGFKNPVICPISARAGYLAKQIDLSKTKKRELYNYIDKFEKMSLDKYYENQLGVRKIEDSAQEEVQLLKKCGLSYLEKIILKYSRR